MQLKLQFDAGRIFRRHLGVIAALAALYVISSAASLATGRDTLLGFVPMFNLDSEFNAPALFSATALAFAATLAWVTGAMHRDGDPLLGRRWRALGGVLAFLALDEALHLHEKIGIRLDLLHMAGQNYSWLVPYGIAASVVAAVFVGFLLRLPRRTRHGLVGAGAVFVGGAAGMEFVGGQVADALGHASLAYRGTILVEEAAEMLGVALLIRTVLEYATQLQHARQHDLVGDALAATAAHDSRLEPAVARRDAGDPAFAGRNAAGDAPPWAA